MSVLVTGAAGFIGYYTATALVERGEIVIGLDNLNEYYDVSLKRARLANLNEHSNFVFYEASVEDRDAVDGIIEAHPDVDQIVHLAAQVGVRYSLESPFEYISSNVLGQVTLLEAARRLKKFKHFVYASSSSVYGGNTDLPFSEDQRVERPISVYATSKLSCEMMAYCYAHLYRIPVSGLRYFTVYGPWGRPDMAAMTFIRKIAARESVQIFNYGNMKRDFTFIDDILNGTLNCLERPPIDQAGGPPSNIYNLGNNCGEDLMKFVRIIEREIGIEADIEYLPLQPGDVPGTLADIEKSRSELDYEPRVTIEEGLLRLVEWYVKFYELR